MQPQNAELREWTLFWQSDQLDSCVPVADPGAGDRLRSVWRAFFDSLPAGARILDLGTGNGSLASQAVEVSRSKPAAFSVEGVDLADVDPARFVSSATDLLREVRFHPGTPMEALPFPDERFDAVCSQYGIEYSDTGASLPETLRVLRPGGGFRFLLHAASGVLKDRCRTQRRQARAILDSDLFPRLEDMLEKIVRAERQRNPETLETATQAIAALKAVLDDLERGFPDTEDRSVADNLFAAVRRLPGLRRSHDLAALTGMARGIRELLLAQEKRLQAMEEAALDRAAAKRLVDALRDIGAERVTLEHATAGASDTRVGYWLHGRKSAAEARDSAGGARESA